MTGQVARTRQVDDVFTGEMARQLTIEDDNAVSQINSFVDVGRYEENRTFFFLPYALNLNFHEDTGLSVELTEWFVKNEKRWFVDICTRDTNTLFHTTGKLVWIAVFKASQTNEVDVFLRHFAARDVPPVRRIWLRRARRSFSRPSVPQ